MSSVIIFSKDRPLQLHAYIESLLYFSELVESNITVLYRKTQDSDYSRVITEFPLVKFIEEENFQTDLVAEINLTQDHIMFGCDDVVFTNHFNVGFAEKTLDMNEQIFGFSFRLGLNITPFPKDVITHEKFVEWNWSQAPENHYNYPWELCATLYRKMDIIEILSSLETQITNPNFLEGNIAANASDYIRRPNLCCLRQESSSIAITVNRVQDTHCNPVDSTMPTDIHYLNKIYNDSDNKLDIQKISQLKATSIHVGSDYFILQNDQKDWAPRPKPKLRKRKYSTKTFLKNISYLFRYDIKKMAKMITTLDDIKNASLINPMSVDPTDIRKK